MTRKRRSALVLGLAGLLLLGGTAGSSTSQVWRTPQALQKDHRIAIDRLVAGNNPNHEDGSFLDAVGAVWPADLRTAAAARSAATGFLIGRCHVLTNMHVVYTDDLVVDPPVGLPVAFAVGQTEGAANRGALRGLRYLLHGVVVAHGDAIVLDRRVHNPEGDWALIRLSASVDGQIAPMEIAAVDGTRLADGIELSIAGYPSDHRSRRAAGLNFKDLWESTGRVVRVISHGAAGALIETTNQVTRGNSGSPVFGDIDGQRHVVVGMVQSIRGNGIDVSERSPNVQLLFTPDLAAKILAVRTLTPCP
jgi:V8-like Glu-specific endopeptidase